jgi:hypothetical protein
VVGHLECQFEVDCVSQIEETALELEPGDRSIGPSLWQSSWTKFMTSNDQMMGHCACHVSVLRYSFFYSPR